MRFATGACGCWSPGTAASIGAVLAPMLLDRGYGVLGWTRISTRGCDFGRAPAPAVPRSREDVRRSAAAIWSACTRSFTSRRCPTIPGRPQPRGHRGHQPRRLGAAGATRVRGRRRAVPLLLVVQQLRRGRRRAGRRGRASVRPLTAYAESKVRVEADVSRLADADFSPTFLRNATALRRVAAAPPGPRRQRPRSPRRWSPAACAC